MKIAQKGQKGLEILEPKLYGEFGKRKDYERASEQAGAGTEAGAVQGAETGEARHIRSYAEDIGFVPGYEARYGAGAPALSDALAGRLTEHGMAGTSRVVSRGPAATHPFQATPAKPANAVIEDWNRLRGVLAPQTLGDPARFAADLLRQLGAESANELGRADASLRTYRWDFDRTPVPRKWKYDPTLPLPRNLAFIDAYEGGRAETLGARGSSSRIYPGLDLSQAMPPGRNRRTSLAPRQ